MPGFLRILALPPPSPASPSGLTTTAPPRLHNYNRSKTAKRRATALKTMLYHEDFNIPMCTDFGDPFVRDAFPKEISEPQQRALLDALVQSLDITFTETDTNIKAHGGFDQLWRYAVRPQRRTHDRE